MWLKKITQAKQKALRLFDNWNLDQLLMCESDLLKYGKLTEAQKQFIEYYLNNNL